MYKHHNIDIEPILEEVSVELHGVMKMVSVAILLYPGPFQKELLTLLNPKILPWQKLMI